MARHIVPTDAEIEAARQEGALRVAIGPNAKAFSYERETRQFKLVLTTGAVLTFDRSALPELDDATDAQLAKVGIAPGGGGLELRELDVDISMEGLVFDLVMGPQWRKGLRILINREAGSATSEAKAAAARANGAKGGRPRKRAAVAKK
jgi:hypothetical protein